MFKIKRINIVNEKEIIHMAITRIKGPFSGLEGNKDLKGTHSLIPMVKSSFCSNKFSSLILLSSIATVHLLCPLLSGLCEAEPPLIPTGILCHRHRVHYSASSVACRSHPTLKDEKYFAQNKIFPLP